MKAQNFYIIYWPLQKKKESAATASSCYLLTLRGITNGSLEYYRSGVIESTAAVGNTWKAIELLYGLLSGGRETVAVFMFISFIQIAFATLSFYYVGCFIERNRRILLIFLLVIIHEQ